MPRELPNSDEQLRHDIIEPPVNKMRAPDDEGPGTNIATRAEPQRSLEGATITANTTAHGAPQIFVDLGGMTILIRGQRPGEDPAAARPIRPFTDFSSHNTWATDHFGFLSQGDLEAFCAELRSKGVSFPVELKTGVNGSRLCYVAAPEGVSIELMQC